MPGLPSGSGGRGFLKRLGLSISLAAAVGSAVGAAVYFRLPDSEDALDEDAGLIRRVRFQLTAWELATFDWRIATGLSTEAGGHRVVGVTIDDETVEKARREGRWQLADRPFRREAVAAIVERLLDEGASAVVVDLPLWDSAESASPDDPLSLVLDRHPGKVVLPADHTEVRIGLVGEPTPYLLLVESVGQASQTHEPVRRILKAKRSAFVIPEGKRLRVWAGVKTQEEGSSLLGQLSGRPSPVVVRPVTPADAAYEVTAEELFLSLAEVAVEGVDPSSLVHVRSVRHPTPALLSDKARYGEVRPAIDLDGKSRRLFHLFVQVGSNGRSHLLPSAPLAAALLLSGNPRARYGGGRLHVGPYSVPIDERGGTLFDQMPSEEGGRPKGSLQKMVSAWRILENVDDVAAGRPPHFRNDLSSKIAVLFSTAQDSPDLATTPQGVIPAGALLGQALEAFLHSQGIRRTTPIVDLYCTLAMAVLGAFLGLTVRGGFSSLLGAGVYFSSGAVAFAAYLLLSRHFLVEERLWIAVAGPLLAMTGTFLWTALEQLRSELLRRRYFHAALGHWVSPEVVRRLSSELSFLRPERRQISMLCADIDGQSLTQRLPNGLTAQTLSEYLEEAAAVVLDLKGQIDRYTGTRIFAYWGAPVRSENHASLACEAAIRLREAIGKRRAAWEERHDESFELRIGINTGEAAVGDFGTEARPQYTVLGDAASLASQLQRAAKAYGAFVITGEGTARAASDRFAVREIDRVRLRATIPVQLFELVGLKGTAPEKPRLEFDQALLAYHQRRFDLALEGFSRCRAEYGDAVAALYIERCREYLRSPPPVEWDGVWDRSKPL